MPSIFVTDRQRQTWARLRQENHSWFRLITARAMAGTSYSDNGLWAALAFAMTGDEVYVTKALVKLAALVRRQGMNDIREYGWQEVMILDLLWDALTAADRAAIIEPMNAQARALVANTSLPDDFSIRATDSDQMIGGYGFLATFWLRTVGEGNTAIEDIFRTEKVGGFMATEPPPSTSTYRNCLDTYLYLNRGGEHIESVEYNTGTLKTFLSIIHMIETATGLDCFPMARPLVRDLAEMFPLRMTPDRKNVLKWGDEQNPRQRRLFYWLETLMVVCGASDSAECRWLVEKLAEEDQATVATDPDAPWARAFLFYDPFGPKTEPPTHEVRFADGMNVLLRRDGDALFQVVFPPSSQVVGWPGGKPGGIDHTPAWFGRVELYRDGAHRITTPEGYGGPAADARANGGYMVAGLPFCSGSLYRFNEFRDVVVEHSTPDYTLVQGVEGGQVMAEGSYRPPGTFCHEHTRSVLYLPRQQVVVIVDRVAAESPWGLPNQDMYRGVLRTWMLQQPVRQAFYHFWNRPSLGSEAGRLPFASATDEKGERQELVFVWPAELPLSVVDEKTLGWTAHVRDSEQRWHVRTQGSDRPFEVQCAVWQTKDFYPVERVPGGVVVGETAWLFNDTQAPRAPHAPYTPGSIAQIGNARVRFEPFSTTLPRRCDVLITDLDPEVSWSVNGRALEVSSKGIARLELAAGTHIFLGGAPAPLPEAPADVVAEVRMEQSRPVVVVSWRDLAEGRAAFAVERQENAGAWVPVGQTEQGVTSYEDRTVALGRTYLYRVSALNAAGISDPTVAREAVHIINVPPAPADVVVTVRFEKG